VKEAKYALHCNQRNQGDRPEIKPVILQGPPVPRPPRSLSKIHFNDRLRYLIAAAQLDSAEVRKQ